MLVQVSTNEPGCKLPAANDTLRSHSCSDRPSRSEKSPHLLDPGRELHFVNAILSATSCRPKTCAKGNDGAPDWRSRIRRVAWDLKPPRCLEVHAHLRSTPDCNAGFAFMSSGSHRNNQEAREYLAPRTQSHRDMTAQRHTYTSSTSSRRWLRARTKGRQRSARNGAAFGMGGPTLQRKGGRRRGRSDKRRGRQNGLRRNRPHEVSDHHRYNRHHFPRRRLHFLNLRRRHRDRTLVSPKCEFCGQVPARSIVT